MSSIRPYYIIPLLVEQPTWGGDYIAKTKQLSHHLVDGKRIGQAFELFAESWLTVNASRNFAFATASTIAQPETATEEEQLSLQALIDQDALGVLGQRAVDRGWKNMQVLIKFTQAQNNSYQVHVRPGKEFGKWLPKPESWYFLEQGRATLGLENVENVNEYKLRCLEIDKVAQVLSRELATGSHTLADARAQLAAIISQDHPRRFVNTLDVPKGAVIDLSQGGIHHSWEETPHLPDGNIVYEVQVNVMDEFCTLRSFDQGNIKDDGSVRSLTIDDYFAALDLDPQRNRPDHYLQQTTALQDGSATITPLFNNQFYASELIEYSGSYTGKYTTTADSFHHVYALAGETIVRADDTQLTLQPGWSAFVPAGVGQYALHTSTQASKAIITHI